MDEWVCDHVVDCVANTHDKQDVKKAVEYMPIEQYTGNSLAVGKISEWALLVDDANGGLLRAYTDALNIV